MICEVPYVERFFLAHRDTIFGALRHNFFGASAVLVQSAHKTLELFDPKDYSKPNDAVLIDVEVATRQGDCNW